MLREEVIKFGITAAVHHPQVNYGYIDSIHAAWAGEPDQCINYVSCHDNYTLWDKLKLSLPKSKDEDLRKRMKMAGALVLTSQGIPLLHAGVDFCRTKDGNGNSYKSPDNINQIDWSRKSKYKDVFEYYRQLVALRKNHPGLRMTNADMIRNNLDFCHEYTIGIVSYCIDGKSAGDRWDRIFLIFNSNAETFTMPLPEGKFLVVADGNKIDEHGIETIEKEVLVEPVSLKILVQAEKV